MRGDRINQLEVLYSTSLADWEWKFLSILGSISTSVHQLSLWKLKIQCKTRRSFKVIFSVS